MSTKNPSIHPNHHTTNRNKHPKKASQTSPKATGQKPAPAQAKTLAPLSQRVPDPQPPTPKGNTRRRRQQTFLQRLAHFFSGSWVAIITGLLLVGIIVFAITATHSTGSGPSTATPGGLLAVGTIAPAIGPLQAADGSTSSLADYKGKAVVLELFAPWCPHCQNETSVLKQIQQNDGGQGVQVLSVSASPYGRNYESGDQTPISMSDIQWFSSTFSLNYPGAL